MNTDDESDARRFKASLVRKLEPGGIGEDRIHVEYQAELQDYEILVSGGELTDEQIAFVRQVTRLGGCLEFTNPQNKMRLYQAQVCEGRALRKARAAELVPELVGLPQFDPSQNTLANFAMELEAFCGLEPRSTLQARDSNTLEVRFRPGGTFASWRARYGRLNDAVTAALAQHDDVQVLIVLGAPI